MTRLRTDGVAIHALAYVEDSVELGQGVTVRQFASLSRGTVIGEGSSVGPHAVLDGPKFGKRCVISMHVAMGAGFVVGDDCFIGPGVVFCNDTWPTADRIGWDYEMLADGRCVTIRVGDRVGIGAKAVILPGVTIGDGAFVSAGAVVDRNVPAGHLFRRDGSIVEINTAWTRRRMRAA